MRRHDHIRRSSSRPIATLALVLLGSATPLAGLDARKALTQYGLDRWTQAEGLPSNSVHCIVQTRDGYLWLGTDEGLARFDGGRFTVFNSGNTDALIEQYVRKLYEDREGNMWIGTVGGGLIRLRDGRCTTYSGKEGLTGSFVQAVSEGADRSVWIGTADGGVSGLRDGAVTCRTSQHVRRQQRLMLQAAAMKLFWSRALASPRLGTF